MPFTNKYYRTWSSMINLWIEDSFYDLSEVKNLAVRKTQFYLLRTFKRKCFGEYDTVTLTMVYMNVFHDMVSQNS